MALDLPDPDPRPLRRSPLQLAVCQIKHENLARATEARVALVVHERLGGRSGPLPKMEALQGLTINLGVQPAGTTTQSGWRFTSETADWAASLQTDQISLETTAYDSWDGNFCDRLFMLIDAVSGEIAPDVVQRIGLRYVNRFAEPPVQTPQEWDRYLAREVLGLVEHEHLGPGVTAAQQQVDLEATDDIRVTLRYGFFRDQQREQALTFVLDIDTYRDTFRGWNADEIKALAHQLNDVSLRVFQQVVSTEMLDFLRDDDDSH